MAKGLAANIVSLLEETSSFTKAFEQTFPPCDLIHPILIQEFSIGSVLPNSTYGILASLMDPTQLPPLTVVDSDLFNLYSLNLLL